MKFLALLLLCTTASAQNYTIVVRAWIYNATPGTTFTLSIPANPSLSERIQLAGGRQIMAFWIGPFADLPTCETYRWNLEQSVNQGQDPFNDGTTFSGVPIPMHFLSTTPCEIGLQ